MRWISVGLGVLILVGLAMVVEPASAQRWWGNNYEPPERDIFPGNTFTFCRVEYTSVNYGRRGGDWRTDAPDSDYNFSLRLTELTTIDVNRSPDGELQYATVKLDEPELVQYPFIYMIEVGRLQFSDEEATALRDYLLRGGFLMVDDFWGNDEWANWEYEFQKVFPADEFPGQQMFRLTPDHPIFHVVFDLDEIPQVPSINTWHGQRVTYERYDAQEAYMWGVNDAEGRLVAIICHNTDLGDGWEREAQSQEYFEMFSAKKAYPMGINIVVYAMTH